MGKVYNQGIASPKGFDMTAPSPVDERTIVEFKTDLYILPNIYIGIMVQVLASIDGEILREFKYIGGDQALAINWVEVTGGGDAIDPVELPLKFTSFVFKRNIGQPAVPVGGTYEDPVPAEWSNAILAGVDPVWMSSAIFIQGEVNPPVWNSPILTEDTDTTDFEYCTYAAVPPADIDIDGKPKPPLEGGIQRPYWHNDPTVTDDWMAMGNKVGGEYPTTWNVVKIAGEAGPTGSTGGDGRAYKQSTVFTRTNTANMDTAVVTGGSYSSPIPQTTTINSNPITITWHDGIPIGEERVWMTTFTFNDVDHPTTSPSNIWTTPGGVTDTSTDDFEFSSSVSQPANPDVEPNAWDPIATSNSIWMAHRSIANGVISAWGITRIKGETGGQGRGLNISGRDTIANILAMSTVGLVLYEIWLANDTDAGATVPGIVNDAYLYVGNGAGEAGTDWDNIGSITGTDGISFKQSLVFKRLVGQPATPSGGTFADPVPLGWSNGIPTDVGSLWASNRFFADDPTANAALSDWIAPYLAQDTIDTEYKYADMQINDDTPLPPDTAPGGTWYEVPLTTSYWMAHASRVNDVVDDTTWQVVRIKGEKGNTGEDGVPSFLSSVYFKTNDDISGENVTGGTYVSPLPTSTIGGVTWSDGIPGGTGAIWFTQVRFDQYDIGSPTKIWPAPSLVADSSIVEYQFNDSVSKPVSYPVEGNNGGNGWWDDADQTPSGNPRWMAIGSILNGVWPTAWDIVTVVGETGETGDSARTYIPSTMFCRCDDLSIDQVTVTGKYMTEVSPGVWEIDGPDPTTDTTVGGVTYTFTDAVPLQTGTFPNNAFRVWAIQGVLNNVDNDGAGNEYQWGNPTLMADTGTTDYEYSDGIGDTHTKPDDPDTAPGVWYSEPTGDTYWIAQKDWQEGVGTPWKVYLIRGEDGGSTYGKVENLRVLVAGSTNISFNWDAVTVPAGVTTYELFMDGVLKVAAPSAATTINASGLDPSSVYSFTMRAKTATETLSLSDVVTGTTTYRVYKGRFMISKFSRSSSAIACSDSLFAMVYTDEYVNNTLFVGQQLYADPKLIIKYVSPGIFSANDPGWFKVSEGDDTIEIDSNGVIITKGTC